MSRLRRLSLSILGLAAAALAAGAPAAQADTLLQAAPDGRNLAAAGGWLVWAEPIAPDGEWRLRLRSPAGVVTTPDIRPFAWAPDPSIGSDRLAIDGRRLLVVYSRCGGGAPVAGCDVYRYDIAAGTESRVAALATSRYSETAPSFSLGRYAFSRRGAGRRNGVFTWAPGRPVRRVSRTTGLETAINQSRVAYTYGGPRRGGVAVRRISGEGGVLLATTGEPAVPTSLVLARYWAGWLMPGGDVGATAVRTSRISGPALRVTLRSGRRNLPYGTNSIAGSDMTITRYLSPLGVTALSPPLF